MKHFSAMKGDMLSEWWKNMSALPIREELSMSFFYCPKLFFSFQFIEHINLGFIAYRKKGGDMLWILRNPMISGQMELKIENIRGWAELLQHWIVLYWEHNQHFMNKFRFAEKETRWKSEICFKQIFVSSRTKQWCIALVRELKYALDPNCAVFL